MATLALIAFVAWQPGAKAVHDAPQPTPAPCPAPTPGDHTLTIDTPEGQRQVLLHVPPGADTPRPLVLALHGAGETGSDFANDTGFSRLADREGFLVAYPSAGGTELVLEPHRPGPRRQRRRGARALARPAGGCRLR